MTNSQLNLSRYRRIVIKIGSALLVERGRGLRERWLGALCSDIARLQQGGCEVLVVSSGAIALGRTVLGLPGGSLKLEDSQAAAAVGQIALARAWSAALAQEHIVAGQILLTLGDTEDRRRYLNARATVAQLLRLKAVPIVNENDSVATTEIRYGDNDRLAARVATMIGADLLVLLSDVDGLYTASPASDPSARHIATVDAITASIEAMAGATASETARGGMKTKIEAGKIATKAGCAMIIASGKPEGPLKAIEDGARSTWFAPSGTPVTARKTWIAGQLTPAGALIIDDGAARALRTGKSLLPAGVRSITGQFERGDTVAIVDKGGGEIARGLVGYDAAEAAQIAGCRSDEIERILGYCGRSAMVHRDDMVLTVSPGQPIASDTTR